MPTNIPEKYKVSNMPMAATFQSEHLALHVRLVPTKGHVDEASKMPVPDFDKDSPVYLDFVGGYFNTDNKELMVLLMNSQGFQSNLFGINQEDPSGLWRALGYIKVRMRPVIETEMGLRPTAEDVLANLKNVKKPAEEVESVVKQAE